MVFYIDFIASTTLTTAISHIHVPWHACITMSYTLSCCIVHRSVCYGILFVITSHVLQHSMCMYYNVSHGCTTVSRTNVPHIHPAKMKVVTDTSFVTLTDDSQGNPRVHYTHEWKQNCPEYTIWTYQHVPRTPFYCLHFQLDY